MTGVNPGKHNIFDFLTRSPRNCIPQLSSIRTDHFRGRAETVPQRKSKPFWNILGEHDIFSSILRVPMTYPPEPFNGVCLSGMCVPDLRGTQGSFTLYTTAGNRHIDSHSGLVIPVIQRGSNIYSNLPGPSVSGRELSLPLVVSVHADTGSADVTIAGRMIRLKKGEYSDWVEVVFKTGVKRVSGICRFLLLSVAPEFDLYVTPIHIHPGKPAMPISYPPFYSACLSKLHGPFATLGLSEDTNALNAGVLDEQAFLQQAFDIHRERENMFLDAMEVSGTGVCACVFDLTDRVQHMFQNADESDVCDREIERAYCTADGLIGRVVSGMDRNTALFVLSDHGFTAFRRGVNLNAWLRSEGLLVLKADAEGRDFPGDVDWEKTRAYSFGLGGGVFLNLMGREFSGIVRPEDIRALKQEILGKLSNLTDSEKGCRAVHRVYDTSKAYSGPYVDNAPDIVVGLADGYRVSWDGALGRMEPDVFLGNTRHWGGDHAVDPSLVPGTFLCNRTVHLSQRPHIMDIAPTVLALFGIEPPSWMDGKKLKIGTE